MATISVRHLVKRDGPANGLPRYFWQPSPGLRKLGFRPSRVPLDWATQHDERALELAAIARAHELNEEADAARDATALKQARPVAPPAARTLGDLIAAYRASKAFKDLRPSTQRGYRQCLDKLEAWAADVPVRAIDAARVQRLKEALSRTPAFANAVIRVLRLVLEHGRRESWITVNPALRPGLTGSEPTGLIWPREAVAAFAAAADALGLNSLGTAVIVNEWLGQRQGDILTLPRNVLRNGTLWIRQSKTGAGVGLPVDAVPHLVQRLADEEARVKARQRPGAPLPAAILICERTGAAWKVDHFRHAFSEVRALAAQSHPFFEVDHLMPGRDMAKPDAFQVRMQELTFMQLRHTAVTRLAEAECDAALISTITGHSLATVNQILERYMVRTRKMARVAFGRRVKAEGLETAAVASIKGAM